jgi:hypothetical protein
MMVVYSNELHIWCMHSVNLPKSMTEQLETDKNHVMGHWLFLVKGSSQGGRNIIVYRPKRVHLLLQNYYKVGLHVIEMGILKKDRVMFSDLDPTLSDELLK